MAAMSFAHPIHSHHQLTHQSHFPPTNYPPIPNHNIVNFDAAFTNTTGQTSYAAADDSENESNFTSDEFDSEGMDDIDHEEPFIIPRVPPPVIEPEPDIADQLLHFAEMVNKDIQKYFGKRKAIDDRDDDAMFCKDRFASGKSGRELYYADLLKVAGATENTDSFPETSSKLKHRHERIVVNTFDNHVDKKLGPLGELFEYALSSATNSNSRQNQTTMDSRWIGNNVVPTDGRSAIIPWRKRTLPTSFFLEPRTDRRTNHGLTTQEAPDFSDLMAAAADD